MPLRSTDATILIISHGAIISGFNNYFKSQNYRIQDCMRRNCGELDKKIKHCSLSEIYLGLDGPGEIIRVGDCDHLFEIEKGLDLDHRNRLDGRLML